MMKLIPMRRCNSEAERRFAFRSDLTQMSDWTLRDIGIYRQTPNPETVKPFWMA